MQILVRDVMSKELITLRKDMLVDEGIQLLIDHGISGAPVVDDNGHLIGIVSEKDFLPQIFPDEKEFYGHIEYYLADYRRIVEESRRIITLTIEQVMRTRVHTISPEEHVVKAIAKMTSRKVRRLPVVESGELVGIVTTNDVYKKFLSRIKESFR